jgi:hypothetical protein
VLVWVCGVTDRGASSQSRPNPRGGSIAWSSERSSSLIVRSASAVAVSWSVSGRASSHASYLARNTSRSATEAGALLLILQTKFGGDTGVGGEGFADNLTWQVVALIGFAAGFTERWPQICWREGVPVRQ